MKGTLNQELKTPILSLSVTEFSQIKLFLDEFLNKTLLARVTILNLGGIYFSPKTCDWLERRGFAGISI